MGRYDNRDLEIQPLWKAKTDVEMLIDTSPWASWSSMGRRARRSPSTGRSEDWQLP